MRRPIAVILFVLGLAVVGSPLALAHDHDHGHAEAEGKQGSWTGEIVDMACYVPNAAKGGGHAECAKKCARSGQPMGLLTADGDVVLLVADHEDGKPFAAAQDLAGQAAEVTGTMAERGGMQVLTVTGVKAAE